MFRSWFNLSSIKYVLPLLKVTLGSFLGPLLVMISGAFIIFCTSWSEFLLPLFVRKEREQHHGGMQGDVIPPPQGVQGGVNHPVAVCERQQAHA